MNWKFTNFLFLSALVLTPLSSHAQKDASLWLTNPDKSALFQLQTAPIAFTSSGGGNLTIDVDDKKTYQSIDGFGFALTGGSAQLITHMDPDTRAALLHQLFATDGDNIGVSYIRLSVGASDMNDHVFSYDDLPEGQADTAMA